MDFIIPETIEEIENYLSQYDGLFVRKEMKKHFRYYVSGIISETHRKNIQQIMAKVVEGKYQSGHHFLSDSPWKGEEVNKWRIALWQSDRKTRMIREGWFIQDDTGQRRRLRGKDKPKRSDRLKGGTDGVARQYIGNIGKVSEGMVFVLTHYSDLQKRIPITVDLFWPKASLDKLPEEERTERRKRNKIEIALEQLRWIKENIYGSKPRRVTSDPWYGSCPKYINTIHDELRWNYVAGIRADKKIFIRLPHEKGMPEHRAEEVITLFKVGDFKEVPISCSGTLKKKYAVEVTKKYKLKVKRLHHRTRLFLCVDDPSQLDPEKVSFIICNDNKMSLAEVIQAYSLRNWEEVFYRQGKDYLGLDQCEVQLEQRLIKHWILVMVAYTMLETFRVKGVFKEKSDKPLNTIESVIRFVQDLFRWEFWTKWAREEQLFKRFVEWFCSTRGLKISLNIS
jgi:SRSO17 transposase